LVGLFSQGEGESCPFCKQVYHINGEFLVCSDRK